MGTKDSAKKGNEQEKPLKKEAIRNQEYHDTVFLSDCLYQLSKEGYSFENLMRWITSEDNIRMAYRSLRTNKGSKTPGVNGETIKNIDAWSEERLVWFVRHSLEDYHPGAVKRVEIPKPGSDKTRPLGIPNIEDRVIQQCFKQVLEPVLEAKFYHYSYGFRPDRSAEHAIHRFYRLANNGLHYVVDVDIKGFFDNVDHNKLKKQLWSLGIRDKKALSVISEMLRAEIELPNGERHSPTKGTPQGGIISPLLANVVLNELDWWIDSQWEGFPATYEKNGEDKEYSCLSHKQRSLRNSSLKEMHIVRYADDFKIFTDSRESAEKILTAVTKFLKERLKLDVSPEKTTITNLRKKNSEFLGFRIKVRRKGDKWVVKSGLTKKAMKEASESLKEMVKEIQKAEDSKNRYELISKLNSKIMGMHSYYRLATNVSKDFSEINEGHRVTLYNRVLKKLKNPREGKLDEDSALFKRYGKSDQLRFVNGYPLVPVGYCSHSPPMGIKNDFTRFSEKGRSEIHKKLGVSLTELRKLMNKPVGNRTIEFIENRISVYCAQYGKCYITGEELSADRIHCHHKRPISMYGRDDSYYNLVVVSPEMHRLIHAKEVDTIAKYLPLIKTDDQLKRLNKLRTLAGRNPIRSRSPYGLQLSFFDNY